LAGDEVCPEHRDRLIFLPFLAQHQKQKGDTPMNQSLMVHYAVACLEGLDVPRAPRDLSRSQKMPLEDCLHILRQFEAAGLVRENAQGSFERMRSMEALTALEVLQALWSAPSGTTIRMLYGTEKFESDQVARLVAQAHAWPNG
jgi:hypothetical protein